MKQLLDLKELTEITRLSKSTIYTYVASKKIPFVKIGSRILFSPDEIQEWIDKRKVDPVNVLVK